MNKILQPLESDLKPTIGIYLYYRLALSIVLIFMFLSGFTQNILGVKNPQLFFTTSLIYFTINLVTLVILRPASLANSTIRIAVLLLIDVLAQLILIHVSGGMASGLGYLLIVTTAMSSIFLRGQLAYAFAAFVSIAILADTYYLSASNNIKEVFSAGILGILIFATTLALQFLSERVRKSSLDAAQKSRQAKNIQQVAQNIVERMQTGILVVDNNNRIELLNDSASDLLNLDDGTDYINQPIEAIPQLQPLLEYIAQQNGENNSMNIRTKNNTEIRISLASLNTDDTPKNIFYIEDYSYTVQQAQKIKLASLGRLAASIAHEIRNPLGATSHAAQLLMESEDLTNADERMSQIIVNNCNRVNEIVENTLSLSRRKEPSFEQIELSTWIQHHIDSAFSESRGFIQYHPEADSILTRFDPSQLRQVLTNLIQNGLFHSEKLHGKAYVEITSGLTKNRGRPFLEVRDNGAGVPADKINQIFDPFFTTTEKGSGLGLYISKELAEINHARLSYSRTENNLSCFRLDFQHHQRIR